MEIDFKKGVAFLAEPELELNLIPRVLYLFASFVKFEPGKKIEWAEERAMQKSLVKESRHFIHCNMVGHKNCHLFAVREKSKISLGISVKEINAVPMSNVFLMCTGEADLIKLQNTSRKWYEEWFLIFEFI